MITYLPSDNFHEIAEQLTDEHLSKAMRAATEVLKAIHFKLEHPCKILWEGYAGTLNRYQLILHEQWRERKGRDFRIKDGVLRRAKPIGKHESLEGFEDLLKHFPRVEYKPITWGRNVFVTMQNSLWRDNPEHYTLFYRINYAQAALITHLHLSRPAEIVNGEDPLHRSLLI